MICLVLVGILLNSQQQSSRLRSGNAMSHVSISRLVAEDIGMSVLSNGTSLIVTAFLMCHGRPSCLPARISAPVIGVAYSVRPLPFTLSMKIYFYFQLLFHPCACLSRIRCAHVAISDSLYLTDGHPDSIRYIVITSGTSWSHPVHPSPIHYILIPSGTS